MKPSIFFMTNVVFRNRKKFPFNSFTKVSKIRNETNNSIHLRNYKGWSFLLCVIGLVLYLHNNTSILINLLTSVFRVSLCILGIGNGIALYGLAPSKSPISYP